MKTFKDLQNYVENFRLKHNIDTEIIKTKHTIDIVIQYNEFLISEIRFSPNGLIKNEINSQKSYQKVILFTNASIDIMKNMIDNLLQIENLKHFNNNYSSIEQNK